MTIASASYRKEYDGNDSTTVFPYDFLIFDEDHLTVTLVAADDTETTLTIATDYTVSGVGVEAGGNVTYPVAGSPLATGEKLVIRREVPLTQLTDLADQGPWHPQTIEDSLDYAMMVAQQLQEQVDRASLAAVGSGSPLDLTAAVAAAQAAQVAAEAAAATIATFASTAEAQAGTITDKVMSPKRTAEAITAQVTPFSLSGRTYYVEDQKPLGTGSGGSTGGTYHKRDLNTEVIADISGASLASNVVTLPAGTYIIHASAPAFRGDSHKLTLKNDTAVTTVAYGTSAYAARTDGAGLPERGGSASTLTCLLTLAVSSNLSLQHWIETSHSGNGLGYSTGIGGSVKEVFSSFLAFKIS